MSPQPAQPPVLRFPWLRAAVMAGALAVSLGAQEKPTLAVLVLQGAFTTPQRPADPGAAGAQGQRNPRRFAAAAVSQPPARQRPLGELLVHRIDMAYLKTGRFQVIERSQMGAVLKEGVFEQKGTVDDATAVTLGKQLGAKFVVVGSYNGSMAHGVEVETHVFSKDTRQDFYPAKLEVRLRIVRTEDGTIQEPLILNAAAKDPQPSKAFELLMDDFGRVLEHELAVRYPMAGYVVKTLSDKEVLSDLGRSRGVEPGDVFLVLERGPDVVHPVTGKLIPGERKVVGEMVVTDAGPESSTLRLVSGRQALKPGTMLERRPK